MLALHPHIENKSHVIWDWNGTLLSDIDHAVRVVNKLLAEEKLKPTTVDDYKKVFGFPVVDYYKRLGFDTSPKKFHELCVRFNQYFYGDLNSCELWPGAREALAQIKKAGKTQSLLSASEQKNLNSSVRHYGVAEFFHHVVGIHNIQATSKVDRGRELMARVNISTAKTVLIGDTDHDLEVGQALGIDVILVEHGHQCPTRLREIHEHVVKIF
jgi:phosphoglycolate phosphatase